MQDASSKQQANKCKPNHQQTGLPPHSALPMRGKTTKTRDKEGHYLMIKGSIQEEDITIVNIYAPNIGAPQYIRQTLTDRKGEIVINTIIVGDFLTPHSHQWTDHQNRN